MNPTRTRRLSPFDRALGQFDRALRTLTPPTGQPPRASGRPQPQPAVPPTELSEAERRESAALMRVNHCGEVCAQGLYQGQSLTAHLTHTRAELERAADEEIDHLAWCETRLRELDGRTSWLNPLWYGLSFGLGAAAGAVGDRVSLGFVAATEELVARHLESHLERLPAGDTASRAVVTAMLEDERAHGATALNAGGQPLPRPVKRTMATVAKLMTGSTYYL